MTVSSSEIVAGSRSELGNTILLKAGMAFARPRCRAERSPALRKERLHSAISLVVLVPQKRDHSLRCRQSSCRAHRINPRIRESETHHAEE